MSASAVLSSACRQRFLAPQHAFAAGTKWQVVGRADTPAADAVCELYLAVEQGRITAAAFTCYGPPVAIACADWVCEQLRGRTIAAACGLCAEDVETALVLAPQARYGAMLALDALNNAIADLEP